MPLEIVREFHHHTPALINAGDMAKAKTTNRKSIEYALIPRPKSRIRRVASGAKIGISWYTAARKSQISPNRPRRFRGYGASCHPARISVETLLPTSGCRTKLRLLRGPSRRFIAVLARTTMGLSFDINYIILTQRNEETLFASFIINWSATKCGLSVIVHIMVISGSVYPLHNVSSTSLPDRFALENFPGNACKNFLLCMQINRSEAWRIAHHTFARSFRLTKIQHRAEPEHF